MDGILIESSARAAAQAWLDDFAAALDSRPLDSSRAARIAALFADECHWRNILAFTWNLCTASGAAAIAQRMAPALARLAPRGLGLAEGRTPPRRVVRAGIDAIEAIFVCKFRTAEGLRANSGIRLRWAARDITDPHSRIESQTFIEATNTWILSTALKQDVIAIARPSFGKGSLNYRATMPLPAMFGMGYDIFEECVSTSAAQKIRRGDEHAGRCYPCPSFGDEKRQSFARQRLGPDAHDAFGRIRNRTHFGYSKKVKQAF